MNPFDLQLTAQSCPLVEMLATARAKAKLHLTGSLNRSKVKVLSMHAVECLISPVSLGCDDVTVGQLRGFGRSHGNGGDGPGT